MFLAAEEPLVSELPPVGVDLSESLLQPKMQKLKKKKKTREREIDEQKGLIQDCKVSFYIGIELTNEAGEIVVLEISGQDLLREVKRVDDDEAVAGSSPRDQIVRRWIVDHLISLHNERCYVVVRCLHPIYSLCPSFSDSEKKRRRRQKNGCLKVWTG